MKDIILTFFIGLSGVLFSQNSENIHPCAHGKIQAFSNAKTNTHKSIPGQEKYDLNYVKLDLTLDNLSTTIDAGYALLRGEVTAFNLDVFVLELHPNLLIDSAKINGLTVNNNRIGDELQLFLASNLTFGDEVETEIYYHGTPPNMGSFFGGIFHDTSPSWGAQVTWTLSQPFSALTWWPCKQVLTDKIDSSEVWLTVPNNLKAGSNGLLQNEVALTNNKTRFEWKHGHPIDYYLISLAVGPYIDYSYNAPLPGTSSTVLIQNYVYDNPNTFTNFEDDINETADMMFFFCEAFGMYPFADEKYGHCMAPLSGGMEHQTMTTQGYFERTLTAHELGHQWFGDNVTCESWGHIWVNEGFASYSEYLYLQTLNQNNAQQFMSNVHNNVMSSPGGSVFVSDETDEGRIFSSRLSYDKGSAIVHILRHWINDDVLFFQALTDYQNTFAEGTASAEDLISSVESSTGTVFTNFLEHWYYGEGYPTYSGSFNNFDNGVVVQLSQTSSRPGITPFFASYMELEIDFIDGSDTIVRINNTMNQESFFFAIDKPVYDVRTDPNNWIINQEGVFAKDETLTYTPTGIQNENKVQVNISPNPSDGSITIFNEDGAAKFRLYDALGREVYSKEIFTGENRLELNVVDGIYYGVITIDGKTKVISLSIK